MKRCFVIGGEISLQKKFLEKVNAVGYPLEYIGGYNSDVNPANMNIPNDCVCMILKDKISHKQRDLARSLCNGREGITFVEASSKISHAINTLSVVFGVSHLYEIRPLAKESVEEDAYLNAVMNLPWQMFTYSPKHAGSRKTLAKYWLSNYRNKDNTCMPSVAEIKKGAKVNPMALASEKLRKDRPNAIKSAKTWLLGAEEDNYTFISKFDLNRALKMTFGLTTDDLPEVLWYDLIKGNRKEEPEVLQPLEPLENLQPLEPQPTQEENNVQANLKETAESLVQEPSDQDEGVFICGAILQISGTVKIQTISVDDLLVCGPYDVSIDKVENNTLYGVIIKLKGA